MSGTGYSYRFMLNYRLLGAYILYQLFLRLTLRVGVKIEC